MFSGFLQCNDKKILINHFSIFNTYFSLSFNNSQRINQEQILKIKKQVKYVEELIDHFSKINVKINSINKDLKKLLSIHLDFYSGLMFIIFHKIYETHLKMK